MAGRTKLTIGVVILVIIIIIAGVFAYQEYFAEDYGGGGGGGGGGGDDNIAPNAVFTTNWTANTRVGELIEFNATQSSDEDGEIIVYKWDFDDGKSIGGAGLEVVNHTYLNPGEFFVNLTVTDDDRAVDFATRKIIIRRANFEESYTTQLSATDIVQLPIPSNDTYEFPIEEDAVVANVSFVMYGGSVNSDENFQSYLEIEILNPFYMTMVHKNISVLVIANVSFEFYTSEIATSGTYQVQMSCKSGSLPFIEVSVRIEY